MSLDVYAVRPANPNIHNLAQWREQRCNWLPPVTTNEFEILVDRGTPGGLPLPSNQDVAGFYAAPFVAWAADTYRFDMYSIQDPTSLDDFALRLRVWVSARNGGINVGNGEAYPLNTFRMLYNFTDLCIRNGLWWSPES